MHQIEEGDKGGIKELFCPYIQNDPDLEKQIDKIFEIIDSPVSSIGEIDITSSRESIRDGKQLNTMLLSRKALYYYKTGKNIWSVLE